MRANHSLAAGFIEEAVYGSRMLHICPTFHAPSIVAEYRVRFVPRVLRVLEYWWVNSWEHMKYERY